MRIYFMQLCLRREKQTTQLATSSSPGQCDCKQPLDSSPFCYLPLFPIPSLCTSSIPSNTEPLETMASHLHLHLHASPIFPLLGKPQAVLSKGKNSDVINTLEQMRLEIACLIVETHYPWCTAATKAQPYLGDGEGWAAISWEAC